MLVTAIKALGWFKLNWMLVVAGVLAAGVLGLAFEGGKRWERSTLEDDRRAIVAERLMHAEYRRLAETREHQAAIDARDQLIQDLDRSRQAAVRIAAAAALDERETRAMLDEERRKNANVNAIFEKAPPSGCRSFTGPELELLCGLAPGLCTPRPAAPAGDQEPAGGGPAAGDP